MKIVECCIKYESDFIFRSSMYLVVVHASYLSNKTKKQYNFPVLEEVPSSTNVLIYKNFLLLHLGVVLCLCSFISIFYNKISLPLTIHFVQITISSMSLFRKKRFEINFFVRQTKKLISNLFFLKSHVDRYT